MNRSPNYITALAFPFHIGITVAGSKPETTLSADLRHAVYNAICRLTKDEAVREARVCPYCAVEEGGGGVGCLYRERFTQKDGEKSRRATVSNAGRQASSLHSSMLSDCMRNKAVRISSVSLSSTRVGGVRPARV